MPVDKPASNNKVSAPSASNMQQQVATKSDPQSAMTHQGETSTVRKVTTGHVPNPNNLLHVVTESAIKYHSVTSTVHEVAAPDTPLEKPLPVVTNYALPPTGQYITSSLPSTPLLVVTTYVAGFHDKMMSTQTPTTKHELPKVTEPMKWSRVLNRKIQGV